MFRYSGMEKTECQKILSMRQCDAERMGINRGTRWRIKKCAESGKPFTLNKHVRERLEKLDISSII